MIRAFRTLSCASFVLVTTAALADVAPLPPATAIGDGFVDANDVCGGSADLSGQDDMFRPFGGWLIISPVDLAVDRRAALSEAMQMRAAATGALWRVASPPGDWAVGLPIGIDAVMIAACGPGAGPATRAYRKPSGGLAVRWEALPPSSWASAIADRLAQLEGTGPI